MENKPDNIPKLKLQSWGIICSWIVNWILHTLIILFRQKFNFKTSKRTIQWNALWISVQNINVECSLSFWNFSFFNFLWLWFFYDSMVQKISRIHCQVIKLFVMSSFFNCANLTKSDKILRFIRLIFGNIYLISENVDICNWASKLRASFRKWTLEM